MNLQSQFNEQNLFSNWFRNALITLLVALTFYNNTRLPINILKIVTLIILLFALAIIILNIYLSHTINTEEKTYHKGYFLYLGYFLLIIIITLIMAILFSN